jgi:hypothetical protein
MSLLNFSSLDFDQIKDTLKNYLKTYSNFTDYDFEGSNLSTIIDVLAYNTYITSYNTNMVANEVFIDSATLRENVVSLARNIGYVPRSKKSSRATINFFADLSDVTDPPTTLTLKKGPVAASGGNFNNQSFVFGITQDITAPVIDQVALFDEIEVYEGSVVNQTYEVDFSNANQRFLLTNSGIDLDTLVVKVKPTENSTISLKYSRQDNLFDEKMGSAINGNSKIYFLQEVEDERYEIIFGDGIFGEKLENGNVIEISYIRTSGPAGNGITDFLFSGRLEYTKGSTVFPVTSGISLITAVLPSSGGEEIESVESVRKYAPQIYATQNRALTANDFEILIPNKIYPEAESISVYGGEDLIPPQYGKVFISIKPRNGDFIPNTIKENIKRDLRKYSVAGIIPEILDLKYLYVEAESKVYYNPSLASNASELATKIQNNITKYADSSELNRYGARFKYSQFLRLIDQSHSAITSNITTINIRRDLRLALNQFAEYAVDFGNEFYVKSMNGYNIKSSAFRVIDINEDVYLTDVPNADKKTGVLNLFSLETPESKTPILRRSGVGLVNYEKGRVTLNPINIISGKTKDSQQILEISTCPLSNDVIGLQDLYLQLDKTSVEMVVDQISSGSSPSGSNYTVSSSYSAGNIVR